MSYLSLIDTRLGTYNSHAFSNGNCLPLTSYPWGMNAFCLQTTDQNGPWFFNPYEPIYQGIRLTHQPSPWLGDFASFLITPVTGPLKHSSLFHRQSSYQLDEAIFRPDLLKLKSNRYHIASQLTPSCYGANLQCQSLTDEKISLVFFLPQKATCKLLSPNQIGIILKNSNNPDKEAITFYSSLSFSVPIHQISQLVNETAILGNSFSGEDLHIRVDFNTSSIDVQLATSYISLEQACSQLNTLDNFEQTQTATATKWEELLSRIQISDDSSDQKTIFYHCLYRTLLFPQTFHEHIGQKDIKHFDTYSGQVKQGKFFTNNGYWDTFRTTYPLYSIIYPDYYEDFIEGILNHYNNTGFLPKWLSPDERGIMPGTLVDGVIADAASKGLARRYIKTLLSAMIDNSQKTDTKLIYGRHGADRYRKLGYLPYTYNESVSHSLDYAYSDWCIGQVAKSLQLDKLAQTFIQKSLSYRQLFDHQTGYIRAKDEHGHFREDFDPFSWGRDYAECSAIQSSLAPIHDIDGLITLMGGKTAFTNYLIKLTQTPPKFHCQHYGYEIHEMSEMAQTNLGQLAISNQPSFHIPYLFQFSDQPEYTKTIVKTICQNNFKNDWKSFPGDEDNGSLSAWYIFSCLGFYPICPGKPEYCLGNPAFKQIQLHLSQNTFTITSTTSSLNNQVLLDGKPIKSLSHQELTKHQLLVFHNSND